MVWAGVLGLLAGGPAMAQSGFVVPLQGQTPEQAAADQQQCAAQASSQTGYSAAAPASAAAAPAPKVGQRAAGAVRGAAAGKVVSNVTKNARRRHGGWREAGSHGRRQPAARANRDQRQQTQQQQANEQQKAGAYNSALSACLQARGYTVQ